MKRGNGVFGSHHVTKFYWRVEFQKRGSPHIHGMFWLKDINQFITTDTECSDVAPYLEYQIHNHGHSRRREVGAQQICRFGIPYPPMPQTEILFPLEENAQDLDEQGIKLNAYHKHRYTIYIRSLCLLQLCC